MTQMAHDPRVTERRAFVKARAWVYVIFGAAILDILRQLAQYVAEKGW